MKKTLYLIVLLFLKISFNSEAQIKTINKVIYKVDRYIFIGETEPKVDETLKAFRSLEYELLYDSLRSIYRPIEKLNSSETNDDEKFAKFMVGYYFFKDIKNKEKIEQSEIGGEEFYIIKNYDEYKWQITTETKIINGYKCYKATTYKEEKDIIRNRVNKFNPIVWFAPSLPYPFGPSGLDGLPGLVLEATFNGRIYFYATKIIYNDKTLKKIERPIHGKFVTQEEFLKIDAENFKKNTE